MKEKVLKSVVLLSAFTVIAKVMGFIRSMIVAHFFGVGRNIDMFNLADGLVSNILYAFTTAVSVSFLPIYVEKKSISKEQSSLFAKKIIVSLSIVATIITVFVCLFAEKISIVLAPNYSVGQAKEVAFYLRILSLGIVFSLLTGLRKSILDAEKKFGYESFSGIIYSVIQIVFLFFFFDSIGILALVISVPVAYFFQFVFLRKKTRAHVAKKILVNFKDRDVIFLLRVAFPVLLGNATLEINQIIDRALATTSGNGAVSALAYSNVLSDAVISIISMSLITVFFTEFSNIATEKKYELLKENLAQGISIICFVMLPIMIYVLTCGRDIVTIIYYRGAFGSRALQLTTMALVANSLGWIAISIEKMCAKFFFSMKDTKTPMLLGTVVIIINTVISIFLTLKIGFAGIMFGTVIAEYISIVLYYILIKRRLGGLKVIKYAKNMMKMILASVVTMIALFFIKKYIAEFSVILRIIITIVVTFGTYIMMTNGLKCMEMLWVKKFIRSKIGKS